MTNDDMWTLIKGRTRGFYERIIMPFGVCEQEDDFERAEEYLRFHFHKSSSPLDWTVNFLKGIEETETEIVLHTRKLGSFQNEISNSLKFVKLYTFSDALYISANPPFVTGRKPTL